MAQPTLLKWFTKSPSVPGKPEKQKAPTPIQSVPLKKQRTSPAGESVTPAKKVDHEKSQNSKKRLIIDKGSSSSEKNSDETSPEIKRPVGKRKRGLNSNVRKKLRIADSEDDYSPSDNCSSDDGSVGVKSEELSEASEPEDDLLVSDEEDTKPKKGKKASSQTPKSKPKKVSKSRYNTVEDKSSAENGDANETIAQESIVTREYPHLKFEFLQPERIRDKNGRSKDHPDYDPKTLFVPDSFVKKQTPAHAQWWVYKSSYFDTILFFKMGKFYELFHMDAVIAVNELGILYMKGDYAHAGFPEKAYRKYSDILLQKGYKIGRIEQTETPEQRDERCKGKKCVDKVVSRELCRITTPATRTSCNLDSEPSSPHSTYLLAICEPPESEQSKDVPVFGVCFVETSIGKFYLGQFSDNRYSTNLRTLFTCFPPAEVLLEKGHVSSALDQILNLTLPSASKVRLKPGKEFWDSAKVLKTIQEEYFTDKLPQTLLEMTDPSDALNQKAASDYNLALKAFGAIVYYLKECLIDEELLTMKLFEQYNPTMSNQDDTDDRKPTIIDSISLKNLEIFENSSGGTAATLYDTLDYCTTKFGKRLLRSWLCSPLRSTELINERLDAVIDLRQANLKNLIADISESFTKLPDLERLLSKIHTQGCARRSKNHPDSRAVLFENALYSKRKIIDFLSTIDGFKACVKIRSKLEENLDLFSSKLLRKCILLAPDGYFPQLFKKLNEFDTAFDHNVAKMEGKIIPNQGVDKDYDIAVQDIEDVKNLLEKHRKEVAGELAARVAFVNQGKNRYQLEISDAAAKRCGDEYIWISSRKGFRRFYTSRTKVLVSELTAAEERKENILKDILRRIFESFDNYFSEWSAIVKCVALIDCIMSFSKFCDHIIKCGGDICRPKIEKSADSKPFFKIEQGKHPCLLKLYPEFVPNDLDLRDELLLLSGPNMGGKSTLMRQTGIMAIIAQIGCLVPAKNVHLSPIDAIFTRLGAYDRIFEGQSTFFVELSETSLILKNATKNSLVLLDELGRGTSTYDGTAIAASVVEYLIDKVNCRTLFSTHYHTLIERFNDDPRVRLGHMACMVENENEDDPTKESITFLYQMTSGACPKSYGFNAARLAGIDVNLITKAHQKAKEFEVMSTINRLIQRLIIPSEKKVNYKPLIQQLSKISLK